MSGTAQGSANGPKKIFGRENVNWQGPQKVTQSNTGDTATANAAVGDFSQPNTGYSEEIQKDFLGSSGLISIRQSAVAGVAMDHMARTGQRFSGDDLQNLVDSYGKQFEEFSHTEQGAQVITEDLSAALGEYDVLDKKSTEKTGRAVIDESKMESFVDDGGFDATVESFEKYIKQQDEQAGQGVKDDLVNSINFNPDSSFDDELEKLRLEHVEERGYDSIEDYEDDLHAAEEEYAAWGGLKVARDQAASAATRDYLDSSGGDRQSEEAASYYSALFDDYYSEGFNSETVLNSTLSANSSYEVVDVRDGELEVNEEQEARWASSAEFDTIREDFTAYARKYPYKG